MLFKKSVNESQIGEVRAIEGIVQFQSIRLNVYIYAVDGVLIDTGAKTLAKQFQPFFHDIDVDFAVITHNHEDHTGGASYIQKQKGIPVYMNGLYIDSCRKKANYPFYRKLFWGKRSPFEAQPLQQTFQSRNATWDVILTPGHAKDHLAFYNQQTKQLFSGDLFVTPRTRLILRDESILETIASLQRVLSYDFQELFCQHAGYIKDGRAAIQAKLDYLLELQQKVWALHKEGLSEQQIHDQLFKRNYPLTKVSGGEWDSKHIVSSILKN